MIFVLSFKNKKRRLLFFQWPLQWLPNKTNAKIKIHLIDWKAWISHCQVYNFPITPSILSYQKTPAFSPSNMRSMGNFSCKYNFYFHITLCRPLPKLKLNKKCEGQEGSIDPSDSSDSCIGAVILFKFRDQFLHQSHSKTAPWPPLNLPVLHQQMFGSFFLYFHSPSLVY